MSPSSSWHACDTEEQIGSGSLPLPGFSVLFLVAVKSLAAGRKGGLKSRLCQSTHHKISGLRWCINIYAYIYIYNGLAAESAYGNNNDDGGDDDSMISNRR